MLAAASATRSAEGPKTSKSGENTRSSRHVLRVAMLKSEHDSNVLPIIEEIERAGFTSHNAIAAKLNARNARTARGGTWTHVQVGAILRPFDGASTAEAA
jgi:hypothetical protein